MRITFESGIAFDLPTPETHPGDFIRWSVDHTRRDVFGINLCRCIAVAQGIRLPCVSESLERQVMVIGGEPYAIVHRERVIPMLGVHYWGDVPPDPYIQVHVEPMTGAA